MSESDDDELGDFEDYGDAPESDDSEETTDEQPDEQNTVEVEKRDPDEEIRELHSELVEREAEISALRPLDEENPIGLDPRVGKWDLCYDVAKPGAKVYVVDVLAPTVTDYEENHPDAPPLEDYAGNVLTRFSRSDPVLAAVYVKDNLTKVDSNLTAYPMPASRLTRYPAEAASMVGGSSVEFERTPVPGDDTHRLAGAEPVRQPVDAGEISETLPDADGEPASVAAMEEAIATVLRTLWGANPQAAVTEVSLVQLVDSLKNEVDEEVVEAAVQRAGYEEEV